MQFSKQATGARWGWVLRLAALALASGLLVVPLVGGAQQPKVYRVGMLLTGSPLLPGRGLFVPAMHDLGYIDGQNLVVDRRFAEGRNERFPSLAVELVALKADVIVAGSTPAAIAAMRATATIPIVMVNVTDPVGSRLVASLARSGNNITGSTDFGIELAGKSVELILAAVPKATRIAVLMSDNPAHPFQLKVIQDAAKTLGLTVLPTMATSFEEFEKAFASMAKQNAGALILLGGPPFSTETQKNKIIELAAKARLPAIYGSRVGVDAGGLLSYGQSELDRWRLTATYVDKILKGAKPGDLPVQQPTEFELAINRKTAKALGLTLPQSLLLRADQVIE